MITHKGKENSENLSADGHQGLGLGHTPVTGAPIPLVHGAALFDCVEGGKVQKLPHQRTAALGDVALPFMPAGAHFKEVQTGKLHDLAHGAELPEVSHLSDQAGCRDLADPFERKKRVAVGGGVLATS